MVNRFLSIVSVLTAIALASSASATIYCEVKKTSDGFVALRAAPDAGARVLMQVKSGDDVQIDDTRRLSRGWQPVIWRRPDRTKSITGWMRAGLIEKDCG